MTTSPNLSIEHVAESQNSKEVTINGATDALDVAQTGNLAVDLTSGDATVTAAQAKAVIALLLSGASVVGRTVTLPAIKKPLLIHNAGTESVSVVCGTTTIALAAASGKTFYLDGTANGLYKFDA